MISSGAESNAAITEEVNASAEELSSLLESMTSMVIKLEDSISKFKL